VQTGRSVDAQANPGSVGRVRRVLARACDDEQGFTLMELSIASVLLLILGSPIVAVLVTSMQLGTSSLITSGASTLATSKIELVRAMPFDSVGFPGGNPPGTISSSNTLYYGPTTLDGRAISIAYQITYVNDHGAKTQTYADYKRVVVTITRTSDGTVLATKTTNIAALTGAPDGGSEYLDIRRSVVDMATGNPALANVSVSIANGPSAGRTDSTDSTGSVVFPLLTPNTSTSSFYDVTAVLAGYNTYPADLPYAGTGSPAVSLEQINHLTGYDDQQTIHLYKGATVTVDVDKSDGVTPFPASTTVYMGSGLAGNTGTATTGAQTAATLTQLQLGNAYVTPNANTISIYPGNYTFSGESGTVASMTYAVPQTTVAVPNNYPSDLTKTVKLLMYANPVTSNTTVTVTVKRGASNVQNAHVELSSTATGVANAPSVYVWGNTNSSGQVALIVPRGSAFTIKATDARNSTASLTGQSFAASTATATLTITP
jgi:prepilin-type N-terminal cleavage/methylation domain-containing protein